MLKKTRLGIIGLLVVMFVGCTGPVTGHKYTSADLETGWKLMETVGAVWLPDEVKDSLKPTKEAFEDSYEIIKDRSGNGVK